MRKLIAFSLIVVFLFSLSYASVAEEGDGVDWTLFSVDELVNDITTYLGYKPLVTLSKGGSGKYGVMTIHFPADDVQRMIKYDIETGEMYMSGEDITNLLSRDLFDYISPYKDNSMRFFKTVTPTDTYYVSANVWPYITLNSRNEAYLTFDIENSKFVYVVPSYDFFEYGIIIPGNEIAQAMYIYNTFVVNQ
jgi:hypothetical protein